MRDLGAYELTFHFIAERNQIFVGSVKSRLHGGGADGMAEEVVGHLTDSIQRKQLLNAAIDQPGFKA